MAIEGADGLDDSEQLEFLGDERYPAELLRAGATKTGDPGAGRALAYGLDLHGRAEQRADQELSFPDLTSPGTLWLEADL